MELHEVVSKILKTGGCHPVGSRKLVALIKEFVKENPRESINELPEWSVWLTFIKNFVIPVMKELEKMDCCHTAAMIVGAIIYEYPELEELIDKWISDKCVRENHRYCCKELREYLNLKNKK